MRPPVANCNWISLLLIHVMSGGLAVGPKKDDFMMTRSSSNSLMNDMMAKFSYPKSEVTAGVGYGHHLHPFYYRGGKEGMYPCAVECGEWETMDSSDDSDDAGSNVEEVTTRPDVSMIEITTPKPRPYQDISSLRPKKYQSPTTTVTPKISHDDYVYQDLNGADVNLSQQEVLDSPRGYNSDSKEIVNDGSLYARFHDELMKNHERKNTHNDGTEDNVYFDSIKESLGYNPPTFDDDDRDDVDAPVYPTSLEHPKRERIEEKYTKHNVREEHLEDVRTNSFEPLTEDTYGEQLPDSYNPNRIRNFPPKSYHSYPPNHDNHDMKPFRQSSVQGRDRDQRQRRPQGHKNYQEHRHPVQIHKQYTGEIPQAHSVREHDSKNRHRLGYINPQGPVALQDGHDDYPAGEYSQSNGIVNDSDEEQYNCYEEPDSKLQAHSGYTKEYPSQGNYNYRGQTGQNGQKYAEKHPYAKNPYIRIRPANYGRYQKYPVRSKPAPVFGVVNPYEDHGPYSPPEVQKSSSRDPSKKYASYQRGPHSQNADRPYSPYAPKHIYPPQIQAQSSHPPVSGGIRVVSPPRRPLPPRYTNLPYDNSASNPTNKIGPHTRGQRFTYRQTIPHKDGFTRIVKRYRSVTDHTPKRYIASG